MNTENTDCGKRADRNADLENMRPKHDGGIGGRKKNRYVLLVEDHQDLAATVGDYLDRHDINVDFAADGPSALRLATQEMYDAIVLDLGLPGIDGIEVCRRLRRDAHIATPIIMLTARDQLEDKLSGFDAGADDYLVKPFEMQELVVRIDALIRREKGDVSNSVYQIGNLTLDTARQLVMREGDRLKLSPRSFEILLFLMKRSPAVVSRKELEHEIWGDEVPDSDALRSHLYNLRRVVDRPYDYAMVETQTGRGFRVVAPGQA